MTPPGPARTLPLTACCLLRTDPSQPRIKQTSAPLHPATFISTCLSLAKKPSSERLNGEQPGNVQRNQEIEKKKKKKKSERQEGLPRAVPWPECAPRRTKGQRSDSWQGTQRTAGRYRSAATAWRPVVATAPRHRRPCADKPRHAIDPTPSRERSWEKENQLSAAACSGGY